LGKIKKHPKQPQCNGDEAGHAPKAFESRTERHLNPPAEPQTNEIPVQLPTPPPANAPGCDLTCNPGSSEKRN
jgi:hypothetical protein